MSPARVTSQQAATPLRIIIPLRARAVWHDVIPTARTERSEVTDLLFLAAPFRGSELQLRHKTPKIRWALAPEDNLPSRKRNLSRFAQCSVQLISGLKFLLKFFACQARAQMIDCLREPVKRVRNIILIRKHDIAPKPVRASRNPQQIFQSRPRKRQWQTGFIGLVLHHARKRHGNKLWQMRDDSHGPVVSFSVAPNRLRADRSNDLAESGYSRIRFAFGEQSKHTARRETIPRRRGRFQAVLCPPSDGRPEIARRP